MIRLSTIIQKLYAAMLVALLSPVCVMAGEKLSSPNGRVNFFFDNDKGIMTYRVERDNKVVVKSSRLGVTIDNHLLESALGVPNESRELWGNHWCENLRYMGTDRREVDTVWTPPYGEWSVIKDRYNEMTLRFMKGVDEKGKDGGYVKSKCYFFNIKVRAYDEGVAFRYEFPQTSNGLFLHLMGELTEFVVDEKAKAWSSAWAQGPFLSPSLAVPCEEQLERPLTLRLPDGTAMSLIEAQCVDYVRTKFSIQGKGIIKAEPYSSCDVMTPFSTSWRVIMMADDMAGLCNQTYLMLNLNEAPSRDFTWVQPGKVFRSNLDKKSLKEAVDFAASRGMQYVHLDAGWYGPEMKMESSALAVASNRDFTIPEIVDYAATKGLGVLVYVNQRALYKELDQVLDSLAAWGVRGVKFGFVQVGNQKWTSWLHEAVRKCADRHLLVDIHDEYRPTGYSRTFPNLMTVEGIAGNEVMPDATHNVTLPFTRFLCGPADYTLCYFNGRVQGTRAHQLAMAAVYYSPLTWMFWYDRPGNYKGEPELEFWEKIPTVWDDSKTLQGEPGEYIVTARRSGSQWFVGAMTNTEARQLKLPLDFLQKGKRYVAHLYEDAPGSVPNNRLPKGKKPEVKCSTQEVTAKTVLDLSLVASGGCAIWIEEVEGCFAQFARQQLDYCHRQLGKALDSLKCKGAYDFSQLPRNILTVENGCEQAGAAWNCRPNKAEEWCSGFWPGILWMDYASNKSDEVKSAAEGYTQSLAHIIDEPVYDHDLGFITINSFMKGYEVTKSKEYKELILKAADNLATLYNPHVGTMLSWPRNVKMFGGHHTIMDNMINLELLFWASQNGGNKQLYEMAVRHAETTMNHHFRPDYSCYHVAVYDSLTGKFIKGVTHQGWDDGSMWARGQAWAIYGYTMVYRYTKDKRFLDFAQKVTDVYLKRLKETSDDMVPLWDMDAAYEPAKDRMAPWRQGGVPKDASAACVVASALLELAQYVKGDKGDGYRKSAEEMLRCLSSAKYQSRNHNVAFLMHSTGHHPAGSEIDASIIYADYYYIEALRKAAK